jgi:thiol:disulfide interchange protein DsbG
MGISVKISSPGEQFIEFALCIGCLIGGLTTTAVEAAAPVTAASAVPLSTLASKSQSIPSPIQAMLNRGRSVQIIDKFPVAGTSLTAWVLASGSDRRIYYVPVEGTTAILGIAFDADLNNLTNQHAVRALRANSGEKSPQSRDNNRISDFGATVITPSTAKIAPIPISTASPSVHSSSVAPIATAITADSFNTTPAVTAVLAAAPEAAAIYVEGTGRDVYIIFDPACPYCHRVWNDTRGMLSKMRIHWLPIDRLTADSAGLGEAIFSMTDRGKAMMLSAQNKLPKSPVVSIAMKKALDVNSKLLDRSEQTRVPFIVFSDNGVARAFIGAPNAAVMKKISGQ